MCACITRGPLLGVFFQVNYFFELLFYIAHIHFCSNLIRSLCLDHSRYNVGCRAIDVRCWFRMTLDLILYHFILGHHRNTFSFALYLCLSLSHFVLLSSISCRRYFCSPLLPCIETSLVKCREWRTEREKTKPAKHESITSTEGAPNSNGKLNGCSHRLGTDMNFKLCRFQSIKYPSSISFLFFPVSFQTLSEHRTKQKKRIRGTIKMVISEPRKPDAFH